MPESLELVKVVRQWVQRAEEDLRSSEILVAEEEGPFGATCFHAQQCVEKYPKALLVFKNIDFPKTHSISELLALVPGSLNTRDWPNRVLKNPRGGSLLKKVADARRAQATAEAYVTYTPHKGAQRTTKQMPLFQQTANPYQGFFEIALHYLGYFGFVLVISSLASLTAALYASGESFNSPGAKFYSLAALVGLLLGFVGDYLHPLALKALAVC